MKYGKLPKLIRLLQVNCEEMLFYQYLPIKLSGTEEVVLEDRLMFLDNLVLRVVEDFKQDFGVKVFQENYMYLTVKHQYQLKGTSYNRLGWHSDGFMSEDINYIWSNKASTIFNCSKFTLSKDDKKSLVEMNEQALSGYDITYPNTGLLRLDQYSIHKVDPDYEGIRTFVKISFSKEKYNLKGNSRNYNLNYEWEMKDREVERNITQK